jgi:hypothetical protein
MFIVVVAETIISTFISAVISVMIIITMCIIPVTTSLLAFDSIVGCVAVEVDFVLILGHLGADVRMGWLRARYSLELSCCQMTRGRELGRYDIIEASSSRYKDLSACVLVTQLLATGNSRHSQAQPTVIMGTGGR